MSEGVKPMNPQLRLLMELQDLRAQERELATEGSAALGQQEVKHFHIDISQARSQLRDKIGELEEELSPGIRARYDRVAPVRERVVVPVIRGVCYGCFVSIATATIGDRDRREEIQSCENCGSFIYILS